MECRQELSTRYIIENFDYVLIISSWGIPSEYKKSEYVMELITCDNRRTVVKAKNATYRYSSTAAIKDLLEKEVGVRNVEVLIFIQDTMLLDDIVDNWNKYLEKKIVERSYIEKKVLKKLLEVHNREALGELGVGNYEDCKNIVRVVPGVISTRKGYMIYTWRGERVCDVLTGMIALHVYKKLAELPEEHKNIAVIIDTTHGINYFALALKEGVLAGASMYAICRITNFDCNTSLENLIVYHYNSDPIPKNYEGGIPSLKLHLLAEIPIVKNGVMSLDTVRSLIEPVVLVRGIKECAKWLSTLWEGIDWQKVIEMLLLFTRGILCWSLRLSLDASTPSINDIEKECQNIILRFNQSRNHMSMSISYDWSGRTPVLQVIIFSIFTNILKNLVEKIRVKPESTLNDIDEILEKVKAQENEVSDLKALLERIANNKEEFMCIKEDLYANIVEKLYTSPHREIIEHELDLMRRYLRKREDPKWNEIVSDKEMKVYREPEGRAYLIIYKDLRVLVPVLDVSTNERHFYAHGGLPYGLDWLGIGRQGNIVLCLGDPSKCIAFLHKSIS